MKIFIWFLCFLVWGMFETFLKMNDVLLGALPTVLLMSALFALARYFCRIWDEHKALVSAAEKKYGKQKKWYEKILFPKAPGVVPKGTAYVVRDKATGKLIYKNRAGNDILTTSAKADNQEDKAMYKYSRKVDEETRKMIRLIKHSAPSETEAQRIIEEYFSPILKSTSEAAHTMNEYRNRVNELRLSRKIKSGNCTTEAYAVQIFGKVKSYIDSFCEEDGDDFAIDGKTLKEWQAVLLKFKEMNPNMDYKKIIESSRKLSDLYSELFMRLDMTAMEMYLTPVFVEDNYFPHPCPGAPEKVIAEYGNLFGIETEVFPVRSKPLADLQSSIGFSSLYDAVEVIDRYIEPIAVMIHMSPSIEKLFAFECEFCQMSSPEYVTKKIEEINLHEDLEDYEKRVKIREVCKAAPSSLPGIMSELSRYIDLVVCLDMKKFFSGRNVAK